VLAPSHGASVLGAVSLFEGSPNYKQRRRPPGKGLAKSRRPSESVTPSPAPESFSRRPSLSIVNAPYMTASPSLPSLASIYTASMPPPRPHRASFSDHYGFDPPRAIIPPTLSTVGPGPATMPAPSTRPPSDDVRAFVCPLFSCGRMFKHLEHLKVCAGVSFGVWRPHRVQRHVRSHVPEKLYTCPLCQKRFSRTDHLGQHTRIHERVRTPSVAAFRMTRSLRTGAACRDDG
jgi:hypothetical protein